MIVEEIVLGLVCVAWGGGMLYYAKSNNVSDVVKPFFSILNSGCEVQGISKAENPLNHTN